MNESDTRLHKIDPKLKAAGWGVTEGSRITTEYTFTRGKISRSQKGVQKKADYVLIYKGVKLAIVEAKSDELSYAEGVAQAKEYADMLNIRYTYATNGNDIYEMDRQTYEEHFVTSYPSPDELWQRVYGQANEWRDKLNEQPFYSDGVKQPRYYQETAVRKVLEGIAKGERRILLTLATGTGKTFIAFQIAWKLFQTRWNLKKTGTRPRILFLADRNVLANQAMIDFGGFKSDAMVRIKPGSVAKNGEVPTNGSIFFTIFQTFMCGPDDSPYFGQYPKDFFDLVIIDECHRGGAKDESNWRGILEYFEPAVQLGLTATPRVDQNVNTYTYFKYHAYEYSLKQGIEDGFLTPFRHINMKSNIDDYIYSPDDEVVSGEVQLGKTYTEEDFYKGNIKIRQRDEARVKEFLEGMGETEKGIVFCATQAHAAEVRDMINAYRRKRGYCERVTANDGEAGETFLEEFKNNEKTIPTILTTSEKLSDGRARRIKFVNDVMFWGADGIPISTQRFIEEMFGRLPDFFSSSEDLHTIWSDPDTRDALLEKLEDAGYGEDVLKDIRKIIDAEKCDLLDVLEYIAYATTPIERRVRAERINDYYQHLSDAQKQFVEYIVNAYIKSGVDELRMNKLQTLLSLKFGSVPEGISALGGAPVARKVFKDFQYYLYKIQNA